MVAITRRGRRAYDRKTAVYAPGPDEHMIFLSRASVPMAVGIGNPIRKAGGKTRRKQQTGGENKEKSISIQWMIDGKGVAEQQRRR